MGYFPFFVDIAGKTGLIVGGGQVALRKAEKLLPYGPRLRVVAPVVCSWLAALPRLDIQRRVFHPSDIDPTLAFVIAATDNIALNRLIAAMCREKGILVNVVDRPEDSGFLFPALVQRGPLSVGISTSGASPTAAIWLKERVQNLATENMEQMLDWMQAQREALRQRFSQESERAAALKALFSRSMALGRTLTAAETAQVLEKMNAGHVALVGAGCGGLEWLTVGALRRLQTCDTVVYDALIHEEILAQAPVTAEKISVGKRAGRHSMAQEEINQLLVELARQGRQVVRLKGGDPYVFGRGGEEALALTQAGISYEVVPGISSALAVPLEAGIPVTHRGVSRSVHIITAHTKEDLLPENLAALAAVEGTLVFLMGLGRLQELSQALMQAGKSPDTPAAVLSGGNAEHPARVVGPLSRIAELAAQQEVQAPAIILVGPTADMDLRDSSEI